MITPEEKGILKGYLMEAPAEIRSIVNKIQVGNKLEQLSIFHESIDLDMSIEDFFATLKLPTNRALNAITDHSDIKCLRELLNNSVSDLYRIRNLGAGSLLELQEAMKEKNLSLKGMAQC